MRERGAGDTEVGGLRVADVLDGGGDGVQQKRERGAGQGGEPRADERREEGREAERGEHGDQRDAEHVGGQREDGGAMEVEGHGKHHDGFGDEADQGEFEAAQRVRRSRLREVAGALAEGVGE